jgi:hypothetical protein
MFPSHGNRAVSEQAGVLFLLSGYVRDTLTR